MLSRNQRSGKGKCGTSFSAGRSSWRQALSRSGGSRWTTTKDHHGKEREEKEKIMKQPESSSDDEDSGVCPDPRSRIPGICLCKRCRCGKGHARPRQVPGEYLPRIYRHRLADLPGGGCTGDGHRSYQYDGGRAGYRFERRPDPVPGPRQHPGLSES